MTDPAAAYENLRRESAALLGLDPGGDLTPLQAMQIDLASIVRMEIDAAQGEQLAGKEIDIGRLSVAVAMLGKLLPQRALEAEAPKHDFDGAREELTRLLQGRADALEHEWARQSAIEAEVAADYYRDAARPPAPARLGPPVPARVSYIDAACLDEPSPASVAPVHAPAPRTLTPAEVARRIEASMTAPRNEPWRPFVSENGIRTTSPFAPPGGPPRGW